MTGSARVIISCVHMICRGTQAGEHRQMCTATKRARMHAAFGPVGISTGAGAANAKSAPTPLHFTLQGHARTRVRARVTSILHAPGQAHARSTTQKSAEQIS